MKDIKLIIFFLIVILFSCQNKNPNNRIDIKFINYALETVSGPKWEDVMSGKNPKFLVKRSITNENAYDSILYLVSKLKPMKKEIIPDESYPYLQCVIHYPDGHVSMFTLGRWYNTLDGVAMIDNDSLVKMIRKYSGFDHPPFDNRR
jgi:hypothetical protein